MAVDPEVVKARREEIRQLARCRGCGSTLEQCNHARESGVAQRSGAPEWFGCCAMGSHMGPCEHVEDPVLVRRLLSEIENGHVNPPGASAEVRRIGPVHGPCRPKPNWLLHQGVWWQPRSGRLVKVAEMDWAWRGNTARMLLRAAVLYVGVELEGMSRELDSPLGPRGDLARLCFADEMRQIEADPDGWVRRTPLYRALTAEKDG